MENEITIEDLKPEGRSNKDLAAADLTELLNELYQYLKDVNLDRNLLNEFMNERTELDYFINNQQIIADLINKDRKNGGKTYQLNFQVDRLKNSQNHRDFLKKNFLSFYCSESDLRHQYNIDIQMHIVNKFYEFCETKLK